MACRRDLGCSRRRRRGGGGRAWLAGGRRRMSRRRSSMAPSIAGTPCICICAYICICICSCIPICFCICACIRGGRSMVCRREEAAAASIAAAARSPTPAIRTPAHQSQAVFPGGKYFFAERKKYFLLKDKSTFC